MAAPDPLIGQKLGDYTIRNMLGRGGMARVYRGYDENLDRFAAIKVISGDFATADEAEYTERFQKEARAIARLSHPNIVGCYQFGQAQGVFYLAMHFLEGEDLRARLRRYIKAGQWMPYDEILNMTRDIAQALDYAHEHGVIHRDIKPSNIMMTTSGRAVLTDFGLALSVPEGTMGDTFGTAHYIAPEQAISSAKSTPQSDLYSFGVVLYEVMVGQVPFDEPSAMSVALKHLNDPPPPPSSIRSDFPKAIEKVLLKVLSKDPKDRYQSGKVLYSALDDAILHAEGGTEEFTPTSVDRLPIAQPQINPVTPPSQPESSEEFQSYIQKLSQQHPPTTPYPPGSMPYPPTMMNAPQRNNSTIIIIGLMLLLAVVIIVGAFFFFTQQEDDPAEPVVANATDTNRPPSSTPSITPTLDPNNLIGSISVSSAALLEEPSRISEQVGRAFEGDRVEILGRFTAQSGEVFYLVQVGSLNGWALQSQVRIPPGADEIAAVVTLTATPTATASSTPTATATATDTATATATLDPDSLNGTVSVGVASILAAPDRNSQSMGRGLEGDEVQILGQFETDAGELFYLVQLGNVTGWVLQRQVRIPPGANEVARFVTPTNTPTPSITPTSTPSTTPTASASPTSSPSPSTTSSPTQIAITSTPTNTPLPPEVRLIYNESWLLVVNVSTAPIDVSTLVFTTAFDDEQISPLNFEMDRGFGNIGNRNALFALPPGDCFQIVAFAAASNERLNDCGTRWAWAQPTGLNDVFWLDEGAESFEVSVRRRRVAECSLQSVVCDFAITRPSISVDDTNLENTSQSTATPDGASEGDDATTEAVSELESTLAIVYNEEYVLLLNISDANQDISNLRFVQEQAGRDIIFAATTWRETASVSVGRGSIFALPPGSCYQIYARQEEASSVAPAGCDVRYGWVWQNTFNQFWLMNEDDEDEFFTILDGELTITECQIDAGRCEFSIP